MDAQKRQEEILQTLAEAGGGRFGDDDLMYEGNKFVLPMGYQHNLRKAARFLAERAEAEDEINEFSRTFKYLPWDGAWCAYNAFKKAFGVVGHRGSGSGMFAQPPRLITIPTGPDEQVQVPWGTLFVPELPDVELNLGAVPDSEHGLLFAMSAEAPKKFAAVVEGLFNLVEQELRTNSLYRGKAITADDNPQFIDLRGLDESKVVYSNEVTVQLEANIWSVLRYTEQMRDSGIPMKRAVLLSGPYGTGKSLAAGLTAQEATTNGWTFIQVRPGVNDLHQAMYRAQLYAPAVVFYEDVDVVAEADQGDTSLSRLLDTFDGITAKGNDMMVILTTNHPDRIHKGMLRPGRLDAFVEIGELDADGTIKLLSSTLPAGSFHDWEIDWEKVVAATEGYTPAFTREAGDRAFRYALVRTGGDTSQVHLTTEDLVHAAQGLRPQFELMSGARERISPPTLDTALEDSVRKVVLETVHDNVLDEEAVQRYNGGQH